MSLAPGSSPAASSGWLELEPELRQRTQAQLVFRSPLLQLGRFRARPGDAHFRCSGPPGQHLVAFPRTSVRIQHAGRPPFVTDASLVTYYNPRQLYFREAVSPAGDRCDWLSLRPDVLASVASESDPAVEPGSPEPFRRAAGPCDGPSYLSQRALFAAAEQAGPDEALFVEELALRLVARLLRAATAADGGRGADRGARRELAEAARALLALRFAEPDNLSDLARALGCSVGHLCRAFLSYTGRTLHAHRDALRLRHALDRLGESNLSLAELAAQLGYSSHSHFTAAFRRCFGLPPARLRRRPSPGALRRLLDDPGARP